MAEARHPAGRGLNCHATVHRTAEMPSAGHGFVSKVGGPSKCLAVSWHPFWHPKSTVTHGIPHGDEVLHKHKRPDHRREGMALAPSVTWIVSGVPGSATVFA